MIENKNIKKIVLKELSSRLTKDGFKLKNSSFIRETEPGLYQVIDIVLGSVWGTKVDHIGIGFGITTEEWLNNLINWKRPKVITTADCEIRDVYCNFINTNEDMIWYSISQGLNSLLSNISNYIQNSIIPYFDKLKTRQDIISNWRQFQHDIGFSEGRHLLAAGLLMFLNTDKEEGELILKKLLIENKDNAYFTSIISRTLEKLISH